VFYIRIFILFYTVALRSEITVSCDAVFCVGQQLPAFGSSFGSPQ